MGFGRLVATLAAIMLVSGSVSGRAAEVLRIAYEDKELPPYYIGNTPEIDPLKPGMSVELVRMAAAELGQDVRITRMPWLRCLASLKQGEVDAIFNASFKEDRLENGVYPMVAGKPDPTRRIAAVTYTLYQRKGAKLPWDGKNFSSLADGPVIGAPAGYSIIDDLTKAGVKVQPAPDTIANFKKLASERIDAVATLDVVGDELLPQYPGLAKVTPALVTKDYFVMFSHQYLAGHRQTAEALWSRIAQLRDSKGPALAKKYAE